MRFLTKNQSVLLLIILLTFILGFELGNRDYNLKWKNYHPVVNINNQQPPKDINLDFKLFWETWDLLSRKYIDKKALDPQKLYYGAIQGMVAAVGDPYTSFLPPDAQKATKEVLGGSFEGVGIQLGYNKDKRLVVIAPLKGTPAEKVGVREGEMILKIDSKDSTGLSLPEAVNLIRGPKGSMVKLTLMAENDSKPKEVSIVRDTILVKSVEFESQPTKKGKKIGLIKLSRFGEKTREEWDTTVLTAVSSGVTGIVLDLRNNPGGFLDGAVYIASEFIESGDIVIQEDGQGERLPQAVTRSGKLTKIPLVVLINKGSASASEIVAGAIQDHKRGSLVGENSFGKGTIQSSEDLSNNTGIHITTAKWLTPSGRWIHNSGLSPDLKVDVSNSGNDQPDQTNKKDAQLEKALEILDT